MEQVQDVDTLLLDASQLEPFEIGARLEALLCHPEKPAEARQAFAHAVCADLIAQRSEKSAEEGEALWACFPQYLKSKNRKGLLNHSRRWGKALVAGSVFLKQLKAAGVRGTEAEHIGGAPLPLQGIANIMCPPHEGGAEIHYESRIHDWLRDDIRMFHPVAHLAAAYQYVARLGNPEGMGLDFKYNDLNFHRMIVQLAAVFTTYIRETPDLDRAASMLIPIEWREWGCKFRHLDVI